MKKDIVVLILLLTCLSSQPLIAKEENSTSIDDVKKVESKLNNYCGKALTVNSKYLDDLKESVAKIKKDFCVLDVDIDSLNNEVISAIASHKKLSPVEGKPFQIKSVANNKNDKTPPQFEPFSFVPLLNQMQVKPMATYSSMLFSRSELEIKYDNSLLGTLELNQCGKVASIDCDEYFHDFKSIYNNAQLIYSGNLADKVYSVWKSAEKDWDDYFKESRSQMPWEYGINYYLWSKSKKAGRVGHPLDYQIIFMHPGIVIENVSDAIDGQNTKEALMIEVAGFNYWRSEHWYLPTGASLVTLYADRAETKDWGWGAAIHFDNDLTIGWSKHSGDAGVFISVDLWKLFTDKKAKFDGFRKDFLKSD